MTSVENDDILEKHFGEIPYVIRRSFAGQKLDATQLRYQFYKLAYKTLQVM